MSCFWRAENVSREVLCRGGLLLLIVVVLTSCSTTYIRTEPDDAGMDATVEDAPTDDAFAPDAYSMWPWVGVRDANTDALIADVRFPSGEGCNGLDDDFDGVIDEGPVCGGDFVCVDGTHCACPTGLLDCDSDAYATCEVRDVTTREHCGGCTPCSPAEDCSTQGGTPHCVPARIVDFSLPSEESGITSIIRRDDNHLILRSGAVWRDTGRVAAAVRAWRDTVCFVSDDLWGRLYCGGSSETGLRFGDADGEWSRLPFNGPNLYNPGEVFSIEGGEGIVVSSERASVWGGHTRLTDTGFSPVTTSNGWVMERGALC